ncbi:hypothetical protein EDB80DRAFT_678102 [Ilyonectria destructans]|nr:hypothetical protein EDB80DRAFT_678102 [Ilyonectria destructans]
MPCCALLMSTAGRDGLTPALVRNRHPRVVGRASDTEKRIDNRKHHGHTSRPIRPTAFVSSAREGIDIRTSDCCRRHSWLAAFGSSVPNRLIRYGSATWVVSQQFALRYSTNQSRVTPKLLQGNAPCAICRHMLAPSSQPVTVFSPERFDFMEAKLRFAQNGLSVSQLLEALLETGPRPGAWRGESDWFHFTWTGFAIQLDSNSRRPATRPRFAGGKRRQILAPKRLLLLALGESDR